jgi:chromosomal replication initiator protein
MSGLSETVWADILGHVRTNHPAISRGWFSQLHPGSLTGGVLTVLAANDAQLSYLNDHCVRPFVEAAQAATGRLVSVAFDGSGAGVTRPEQGSRWYEHSHQLPRLNGDYIFSNFVMGPCNRLAHASSMAVSESPGTVYNPLFIHGSVGLGKTHLLQAICHTVLEHSPTAVISYLTCETFVNHFVEALARGGVEEFRHRYRQVDLLMIDDIQFLAGKDQTQEEFFHTFNALYQLQKQIVISADCSPSEIPHLEERLISRFKCGLVARIDSPCLETRLAIIQKKMRMRGEELPEDVVLFLASKVKSNARELEGALNRLHSIAALDGRKIDMEVARRSLDEGSSVVPRQVRIQEIMGVVTERFGVKLSELQGRRRSRSIALPRQVCMYLARQFTQHSLDEIGGFFGDRDHTTVLHANKLITKKRELDVGFRARLDEIEDALTRG